MVGQLVRGMYEFLILNLITLDKAVKLEVEGPIESYSFSKFSERQAVKLGCTSIYLLSCSLNKVKAQDRKQSTKGKLLAELFNDPFIVVCSWDPHDWLDSWRNFWDLKLEKEGGNLVHFNAAIHGRVEPQLLWCRKLSIFTFSQRWGFNNFFWIFFAKECRRWGNLHFWGLWLWRYVSVQCLLSVVFLALWFVNFFLTLNFKASIIYRFFSLSVYTYGIFALWFSLNQMFVIKFPVSFDTDQVERTTLSQFARQKT